MGSLLLNIGSSFAEFGAVIYPSYILGSRAISLRLLVWRVPTLATVKLRVQETPSGQRSKGRLEAGSILVYHGNSIHPYCEKIHLLKDKTLYQECRIPGCGRPAKSDIRVP